MREELEEIHSGSNSVCSLTGSTKHFCPLPINAEEMQPLLIASFPGIAGVLDGTKSLPRELLKDELEALGKSSEERVGLLQMRLDTLREWIKESFEVLDPEKWIEGNDSSPDLTLAGVLSAKTSACDSYAADHVNIKNSGNSKTSHTSALGDTGQNSPPVTKFGRICLDKNEIILNSQAINVPKESENKSGVPPLRIKLVDDKRNPSKPVVGGTGSKNLSRIMMNKKPNEGSKKDIKKPTVNQTPINVFWNYVEPYFKNIDETDLRNLEDAARIIDPAPFTVPPLGRHYEVQWRELHGYQCGHRYGTGAFRSAKNSSSCQSRKNASTTLRERLLSILLEDNASDATKIDCHESNISPPCSTTTTNEDRDRSNNNSVEEIDDLLSSLQPKDFVHVDERIRSELAAAGLAMFVPRKDHREDDEICAEMRKLQQMLREQVCINQYRKRRLVQYVRTTLPAQEFYTLLGEIDRQIDAAFARRIRVLKKRKKGPAGLLGTPSNSTSPSYLEPIMLAETRKKLMDAFVEIVPQHHEYVNQVTCPVDLFDHEEETRVIEFARSSGRWLPIPINPLEHVRLARTTAQPVFPTVTTCADGDSSIIFEVPSVIA